MNIISRVLLVVIFAAGIAVAQTKPSDNGWPRKFATGTSSVAVYQTQIEEWTGNNFSARAAMAITENTSKQPLYGVLWFTARAEIDKENRLVTLSEFKVKKINIPMAPEKAAAFEIALQARAAKQDEVIALDRLLADMAINHAATNSAAYEVRNDPPQVFFSTRTAILGLIDGNPVLRSIENIKLARVINTRVLILRDETAGKFYLRLMDGWLESQSVSGPWSIACQTSGDLKKALDLAAASKQVDLLDGSKTGTKSLAEAILKNTVPTIFVSTQPAELLQTQGDPQVDSIEGTELIYAINTENDIFVHTPSQDHYILLSGRWFKAQSMLGPWQYVAGEKLPADFAKIPVAHKKAAVLVSVPGTPQAKEALIANNIPQTATITRRAASLTVSFDGTPQFRSIENTTLTYAANASIPAARARRALRATCTRVTPRLAQETLTTIHKQMSLAGEQPAVSGTAQRARSLPARADSRTTRTLIPVWLLVTTTSTPAGTAMSIATTGQPACSKGPALVGSRSNAPRTEAGSKINNRLAA